MLNNQPKYQRQREDRPDDDKHPHIDLFVGDSVIPNTPAK